MRITVRKLGVLKEATIDLKPLAVFIATYMACICMRRQAPSGDMRHAEEPKRTFGRDKVRIKHDKYLGEFFRKRTT